MKYLDAKYVGKNEGKIASIGAMEPGAKGKSPVFPAPTA
jgi:hypothetical protein